jgi:hypothetical protein
MTRKLLVGIGLIVVSTLLAAFACPEVVAAKPTSPSTPKPKPTSKPKPPSPPTPTPELKPTAFPTPTAKPTAFPTPTAGEAAKPTAPSTPTLREGSMRTPTPRSLVEPSATSEPTSTPEPTSVPSSPTPAPVLVTGRVFDDRDGNGIQDSGERGVGGVAIKVDGDVVAATDADGQFTVPLAGGGKALLSIVPPDGWAWTGEMVRAEEALDTGSVAIALHRRDATAAVPTTTAISAGLGILVLAGGLAFAAVSSLTQAAAVHRLERTYRRHKGLELEHLQAQVVAHREAEVKELLQSQDGWQQIVVQLLADALPQTGELVGTDGLIDIAVGPVPRFTVAGTGEHSFLFTTSPLALRKLGILTRKDKPIPLDASLHPAARVEIQAVWDHLAANRLSTDQGVKLPRQGEWFLIVREAEQGRRRR